MDKDIKVGVSTCLLGEKVRYDGGHKHDKYITGILGKYFHYVKVCPEVECGLTIPREAMRLIGNVDNPRLVTIKTKKDITKKMKDFCTKKVKELKKENLCGFIFKKDSPSSGLYRVKVYNESNVPEKKGRGLFADEVVKSFPLLPVEEEGRLNDPKIRENFIERVFACKRLKNFLSNKKGYGDLVEFHTQHKMLLMSHNPEIYRKMGKLVGEGKLMEEEELLDKYSQMFMKAMAYKTTRKKNVDVLLHIMGYFKKILSKDEKQELIDIINDYVKEEVPLIVPLTIIKHYVRKYDEKYLKKQVYLQPHPAELMLRNHV